MCSFLQGDSYSPVGFCISEMIPFAKLLEESKGHWIEEARNRGVSRTHLFFVDDLPQNNRLLKETNEIIVQASLDTTGEYVNPRSRPVRKLQVSGSGTGGQD